MGFEMESMWDAMKQAHYKRTLEDLQQAIDGAVNPTQAMENALNQVADAMHAEAGTFWFYDRFGDDLIHPTAVYGGGNLDGITLMPGEGLAGKVIETGEEDIIADCQQDPRWAGKADKKTGFITKSMICVPLGIEELTFGSIQIINKKDGLPFDEVDLAFAVKLAEAAAGMLAGHELLRGYIVYTGRNLEDTTTFESIVCAPTKKEMRRLLGKTNCYQLLNRQEKAKADSLAEEMYEIFEKALARKEGTEEEQPKKGLFGWRR